MTRAKQLLTFSICVLITLAASSWAQDEKGSLDAATRVYTSKNLSYSIKLPEGWKLNDALKSEEFFGKSSNDDLGANVSVLQASTPLSDKAVVQHIDLTQFESKLDEMTHQAGAPARRINGTALSEGQHLTVFTIAIKPRDDAKIIQLTIWGPVEDMKRPEISKDVDLLLSSFKPAPADTEKSHP
ncbi:MAG TPA: hypothetical protein VK699_17345 [Terriglobales bacterium]|jgi:hypothetical protein|nr:hypothetical protein [Terriglobales bacterium]